jgi:hypothetical protein
MLTLIDANTGNVPAGHPFTNVTGSSFWTSTSGNTDDATAETIGVGGFFGGQHGSANKITTAGGAWCVRGQTGFDPAPAQDVSSWWRQLPANDGPDTCDSSRFRCILAGEAVLDRQTGLVWQRNVTLFTVGYSQADAATNCVGAVIGGLRGWRLPTVAELTSLQDPAAGGPALPLGHPFNFPSSPFAAGFWSSTVVPGSGGDGYVGYFNSLGPPFSGAFRIVNTAFYNSWCVRGAE